MFQGMRDMQKVKLVGEIAKFGSSWETDCRNIRDIFKLIDCQTPGFRKHLIQAADAGIQYEIKRGEDYLESEEELLLSLNKEDIIITEVPAGAKGGKKLLAAIAIVVLVAATGGFGGAGIFGTGAGTASAGLSTLGQMAIGLATNLALTGIAEIMAPGPESDSKQEEGYLFNGPQNTVQQGLPVPVCYGELVVGGSPISLAFRPMRGNGYGSGAPAGMRAVGYDHKNEQVIYAPFVNLIPSVPTATEDEVNTFSVR